MTGGALSQADATALHRAAKKLRNFNYEDDTTDSANIYGSVNAFIQVYNNTLSSGNKTDDASLNRYSRYLKSLSKEHSSELSRIGITVNSDGSLSANDNLLKSAKVSKVKTLFADDAEYITKVSRYSKKMAEKADSVVLSETLGSNIDLTYHPLRVPVFSSLYILHIDCDIIPLHADLCHASADKRHHRWSVSDIHIHNDRHFEIF